MSIDSNYVKDYVAVKGLNEIKGDRPGLSEKDILLVSQYDESIVGNYVSRHATLKTVEEKISSDLEIQAQKDDIAGLSAYDAVLSNRIQTLRSDVASCSSILRISVENTIQLVSDASAAVEADTDGKLEGYIQKYGETGNSIDIPAGKYITRLEQDGDARLTAAEYDDISKLIVEKDKLAPGVLDGELFRLSTCTLESDKDCIEYTVLSNSFLAVNAEVHEDEDSCGPIDIEISGQIISKSDDGWEPRGEHIRYMSERFPLQAGTTVKIKYASGEPILSASVFKFSEFKINPSDFVGFDGIYQPMLQTRAEKSLELYKIKTNDLGIVTQTVAISGKELNSGIWKFKTDKHGLVVDATPAPEATTSQTGLMTAIDKAKLHTDGRDMVLTGDTIDHAKFHQTSGWVGLTADASSISVQVPYIRYSETGHVVESGVRTNTIPNASAGSDGLMSKQNFQMLNNFDDNVKKVIDGYMSEMFKKIYPVGSIYITVSSDFYPGDIFGGEWDCLPEGYSLVTYSHEGDPDFEYMSLDKNTSLGGSVKAVLPQHMHRLRYLGTSSNSTIKEISRYIQCPKITYNSSSTLFDDSKLDDLTYLKTSYPLTKNEEEGEPYLGTGEVPTVYLGQEWSYVRPTGIAVKVWKRVS